MRSFDERCGLAWHTSGVIKPTARLQKLTNHRKYNHASIRYRGIGRMVSFAASNSSMPTLITDELSSLSSAAELLDLLQRTPLQHLMAAAAALRDQGFPSVITFSPKVFIPLTRLCQDTCGYCTFAQGPVPGRRAYMTLEEILAVCRMGVEQGCTEALFTLGKCQ